MIALTSFQIKIKFGECFEELFAIQYIFKEAKSIEIIHLKIKITK